MTHPRAGLLADAAAGPNVVLIVVDTLRADHLASYGYERPTDEPLARFLGEATRFATCRAPAPWTVPSTASLLTGLLPARHGVVDHGTSLSDDTVTLPEELAAVASRRPVARGFGIVEDDVRESWRLRVLLLGPAALLVFALLRRALRRRTPVFAPVSGAAA